MKRFLIVLVMLALSAILFSGCSGNGITPPPPEEPPLDLLREYTGRNKVVRWPDGVIWAYNFSFIDAEVQTVLNDLNAVIGDRCSFKLTEDIELVKLKLYYGIGMDCLYRVSSIEKDDSTFSASIVDVNIDVYLFSPEDRKEILTQVLLIAAGIKEEKASEGFSENVKEVLYWLYRLEPGYPLL